jgi:hypothetical protein
MQIGHSLVTRRSAPAHKVINPSAIARNPSCRRANVCPDVQRSGSTRNAPLRLLRVGLLACRRACEQARKLHRVAFPAEASGCDTRLSSAYSGGTAPDLHRLPLCPTLGTRSKQHAIKRTGTWREVRERAEGVKPPRSCARHVTPSIATRNDRDLQRPLRVLPGFGGCR